MITNPRRVGKLMLSQMLTGFLLLIAFNPAMATGTSDYVLRDLDGISHRASDYRGKWLVINFWATWCTPCLTEMPEIQDFYEDNLDRAMVWGVSFEDQDFTAIRKFVKELGVTYPILGFGQDPKTGYGTVRVLPTTFVIKPDGLFHHKFEGPITSEDLAGILGTDAVDTPE